MIRKSIAVRIDVEGLHQWPDCNLPHVEYLAHLHRHTFQIVCESEVNHNNRDIEFIDLKHKVKHHIATRYYDPAYGCCNFGSMSCEAIAEGLMEFFGFDKVSVSEDGEFWGIVENIKE